MIHGGCLVGNSSRARARPDKSQVLKIGVGRPTSSPAWHEANLQSPLGTLGARQPRRSQGLMQRCDTTLMGGHSGSAPRVLVDTPDGPNNTGFVVRRLWILPSAHNRDRTPDECVILLGDTTHLMVPFVGAIAKRTYADSVDLNSYPVPTKVTTPDELAK